MCKQILKKHSRTSPGVQIKEFSVTYKKLDLERTINGLEKIISIKNQIKNMIKKKINVKMPNMDTKPLARKGNLVETKKLGLELTMNGLGKPFRKNDPKNRKNRKNQSEIAACKQKTTIEKANFC